MKYSDLMLVLTLLIPLLMKIIRVFILKYLLLKPYNVTSFISMDHRKKYPCGHGIYKNKLLQSILRHESSGSYLPPKPILHSSPFWTLIFLSLQCVRLNFVEDFAHAFYLLKFWRQYFTVCLGGSKSVEFLYAIELKLLSAQNRLLQTNHMVNYKGITYSRYEKRKYSTVKNHQLRRKMPSEKERNKMTLYNHTTDSFN